MLNTEDFIKRLEFIMEHFGLNASSFADKVNVQRSSISHLLSGRNKPSLDFVMKIMDIFPELNLYWLLDGMGSYLKSDATEIVQPKTPITPAPFVEIESKPVNNLFSEEAVATNKKEDLPSTPALIPQKSAGKEIEKIVLFYADGTFFQYSPASNI
jgi:transcriptional regulator with XRE-family HTH domain